LDLWNTFLLSLWLYSHLDLGRFFSFLILYTVVRTPWTGDQLVARPLHTHRTTQTQNERTQTFMPRVGFEPMIPVTIHAFDRAATVIGFIEHLQNLTTNNYDSLAELHTPKVTVTTANRKSSQSSLAVVWLRH
jgi:hypothetical protein